MCRSVARQLQRPQFVEDRRNALTCQLKNTVLFHLIYTSRESGKEKKQSFKEIIAQVVQKKKDDMKKARRKRMNLLKQGLHGDEEFEEDTEYHGLN